MKILCFGKHGLLSQELIKWLPQLEPEALCFLAHAECDITDEKQVALAFKRFKPTHVINAAAYTQVDNCESNASMAHMVNGHSLKHIAQSCMQYNAIFLHFSTDYVFNGRQESPYSETDAPMPINVYGQSKHLGETIIQKHLIQYYICRIQWVFGPAKGNFITAILDAATKQPELRVINDQMGTPTSTTTIAKAVVNLFHNQPAFGLYHFRSLNHTTWYDYAQFVLNEWGINTPIHPVSSFEYGAKAKRPQNGVMNISKWIYSDLYTPPSWKNDVIDYLKTLKEAPNALR
jgi:dTDP-4-dehydrorhamnose reductase